MKAIMVRIFPIVLACGCSPLPITSPVAEVWREFDYSPFKDNEISLSVNGMASLPEHVVILGGQYSSPSDPLHTALLISRDDGHTWKDIGFKFQDSGIQNLQTCGMSNIWSVVTMRKEGINAPWFLLRSVDAGCHWQVKELGFIFSPPTDPLEQVHELRFVDERYGLLTIGGSLGTRKTYHTSDGGSSWRTLWKTRIDPDLDATGYTCPGDKHERLPPNAPMWTNNLGDYVPRGVIRAVTTNDSIRIETCEFGKEDWTEQSRIQRNYVVKDGKLVARPPSAGDVDASAPGK